MFPNMLSSHYPWWEGWTYLRWFFCLNIHTFKLTHPFLSPKYYYRAAQHILYVHWWLFPQLNNSESTMKAVIVSSYEKLSNLLFSQSLHITILLSVWPFSIQYKQCSVYLAEQDYICFPYQPLWYNPHLPHFASLQLWARQELTYLHQLYKEDVQIFCAVVPEVANSCTVVLRLCTTQTHCRSTIWSLQIMNKQDWPLLHRISDRETSQISLLKTVFNLHSGAVILDRHKRIQLCYLHRVYYTPAHLFKIHKRDIPICYKCECVIGDFLHMVWGCNRIWPF